MRPSHHLPLALRLILLCSLLVPGLLAALPVWRNTTPAAYTTNTNLYGIAAGNGVFVALGDTTSTHPEGEAVIALVSPDGSSWTRVALPLPTGFTGTKRIAFVNGKFRTCIGRGDGNVYALSSEDGVTWEKSEQVTVGGMFTGGSMVDMAYGNGRYLAALAIGWMTSTDGINWTKADAPTFNLGSLNGPAGLVFANGVFVATFGGAAAGSGVYTSTDGSTWTKHPGLNAYGGYFRPFVFDGKIGINEVSPITVEMMRPLLSTDGTTWVRTASTNSNFASIAGVSATGKGYRVTASTDPLGGSQSLVHMTTDNLTYTAFGALPTARRLDYGIAISNGRIVGLQRFDGLFVGDEPTGYLTPTDEEFPSSSTIPNPANPPRLINISARALTTDGDQVLIVGFSLGGTGTSGEVPLVLRGAGPELGRFGVGNYLRDPLLRLFQDQTVIGSNNDWQDSDLATMDSVRAFTFTRASRDSGLVRTLAPGLYTAQVSPVVSGERGVALAELYDAGTYATGRTRVLNLSARARVTSGEELLIAGFVIGGEGRRRVLVRACGPGLAAHGVPDLLANPRLTVFRNTTPIASNEDWSGSDAMKAVFTSVGAFDFTSPLEAALVLELEPGAYTAQVSSAAGGSGTALVELYELP